MQDNFAQQFKAQNFTFLSSLRCDDVIGTFSEECISCLLLNMPSGGTATCMSPHPVDRYKKTYGGLMLISNKELKNTQAFGFNPQSIFHGYLKATVSL